MDSLVDKHRQYILENLMKSFQLLESLLCKNDFLDSKLLFLKAYNFCQIFLVTESEQKFISTFICGSVVGIVSVQEKREKTPIMHITFFI